MPLVGKADGNPVAVKGPKLLDQPIIQLFAPFALEKLNNFFPARQKLGAVAPNAIRRIGQRNAFRLTGVPRVLRHANFLRGRFGGKRRKRWAWVFSVCHLVFP